jgi:SAM-dependent methyltransferase
MTKAFDWTGRVGDVWAQEWQRTDRSFTGLSHQLDAAILAVAPTVGTAIDIGCGAGGTSIALARSRSGLQITGIDLSPSLAEIASERAAGLANLRFTVADAQDLDDAAANLLFSRHGVMFFDDPHKGFSALRHATKSGGKLVFSCFGPRTANPWLGIIEAAVGITSPPPSGYAPGPFGLADPDFTRDLLARTGWSDATMQPVDFAYIVGAGQNPVTDALGFLSRIGPAARAMADVAPNCRAAMHDSLRSTLAHHLREDVITFPAHAWIWTATAGEAA